MPEVKRGTSGSKAAAVIVGAAGLTALGYGLYRLIKKPGPVVGKALVFGKVTDGWTGVVLADVLVTANGNTTKSDADGNYQLSLKPGSYHITWEKTGYITAERIFTLEADYQYEQNVAMQTLTPNLETVPARWLVNGEWVENPTLKAGQSYKAEIMIEDKNGTGITFRVELFIGDEYKGGWVSTEALARKWFQITMEAGAYLFVAKVYNDLTDELFATLALGAVTVIGAKAEVTVVWADEMPYKPGTTHTMRVTVKNPTDETWSYTIDTFFNYSAAFTPIDAFSTSWREIITIAAGATKEFKYNVSMPYFAAGEDRFCPVAVMVQGAGYSQIFTFPDVRVSTGPTPQAQVSVAWDGVQPYLPSSLHTATVMIVNPTTETWSYTVELVVAGERAAIWNTDGLGPGKSKSWSTPVTVPAVPGTWDVLVRVTDSLTGGVVTMVLAGTIEVKEVAPPPPPGQLGAADIVDVLYWMMCGHFFSDSPEKLGAQCWTGSNAAGLMSDPRVALGYAWQQECAKEMMAKYPFIVKTVPVAEYWLNYYGKVEAQYFLDAYLQGVGVAIQLQDSHPECIVRWVKTYALGRDFPIFDLDCIAKAIPATWNSVENYLLLYQYALSPGFPLSGWWAPPEMAACCAQKVAAYWAALSDAEKIRVWIKPAWINCTTAWRMDFQTRAYSLAPCTGDALLTYIRRYWGSYPDMIARAQWALQNLDKLPPF
jgi:hypothetical protein